MTKTKKFSVIAAAVVFIALAVLIGFPVLTARANDVLVGELFYTEDFVMEYESAPSGGGIRGLAFKGDAPAQFDLRETAGGSFDMEFASLTAKSEMVFNDGKNAFTLGFNRNGDKLTVSANSSVYAFNCTAASAVSVEFNAEEKSATVTIGRDIVSFEVGSFGYGEYKVSYRALEDLNGASEVYVFSVNGNALNTPVYKEKNVGLYLPVLHDAVLGEAYEIAQPVVYSLSGGISSNVNVEVKFGSKVILTERTFVKGMSFAASESGVYTVVLSKRVGGEKIEKSYGVNVAAKVDLSRVEVTESFLFDTVGVGSKLTLPYVTLVNSLYYNVGQPTEFSVGIDGVENPTKTLSVKNGVFEFTKAGEYRFEYASAEKYLSDGFAFTVTVTDELPAIEYEFTESVHKKGEVLEMPEAVLKKGEKVLDSQTVLYYPSGKAVGNNAELSEGGIYTVEFRASEGGRLYRYAYEMKVEADLHITENETVFGEWTSEYFDEPQTGLAVELTNGKTYELGNIIDLSDNKGDKNAVMSFAVMPYTRGQADFSGLEIKLTDAYDDNNYIVLDFVPDTAAYGQGYVKARASNQNDLIGLEWWNDNRILVHKNSAYGYKGLISFTGVQNDSYPGDYSRMFFNLGFDSETLTLYGTHGWHSSGEVGQSKVITRLADTELYKEAFGGFKTGEVKLSVRAYNFNSSHGRLLIRSIDGQNLTDVTVTDTAAPFIEVDTLEYESHNLPAAVVGKSYPLFSGVAADAQCGALPLDVKVNYVANGVSYGVSVSNGAFVPYRAGTYVIEYSAVDFYGNKASRTYSVEAVEGYLPIDVTFVGKTESAFTGETVAVADGKTTGGHGSVKLASVSVKDEQGNDVEIKDGLFMPTHDGKYSVTYVYRDYVGQEKTVGYSVQVANGTKPVLNTGAVLPMAFIDGGEYTLPELTAYDWSTGEGKAVAAEIYVTDGESERKAENGVFTAHGENGTTATIRYSFTSQSGTLDKTYSVPVRKLAVKTEKETLYDLKGLIVTSGAEVVSFATGNYYVSADSDETFFFANPVLADVFGLTFNIGRKESGAFTGGGVEKIRINLIGSENRDEKFYIEIEKNPVDEQKSLMSVNGGTKYPINGSFGGTTNYSFAVQYNGETRCVTDSANLNIDVTSYSGGGSFNGFTGGKAYCTVELTGVTDDGALIEIISLNGQSFTVGNIRDRIAPSFALGGELKVCYSLGETVTVPKAFVSDVISLKSHVRISVTAPNGRFAVSADGVTLNRVESKAYQIKLDEIGTYYIAFTVWDESGAPASTVNRIINVLDDEPPVITASETQIKAQAGKSVKVNIFSASDNTGKDVSIYLFVQNSDGKMTAVDGDSYTFDANGAYELIAVAYDANGNVSRMSIPVAVGGAK